jgi:hypothetical protein
MENAMGQTARYQFFSKVGVAPPVAAYARIQIGKYSWGM